MGGRYLGSAMISSGHGGHLNLLAQRAGKPVDELVDFSASINPLGPPDRLRSVINRTLKSVVHYPDPYAAALSAILAAHHGIAAEQVVVGNGSTELFYALPRVLGVKQVVVPVPSYGDYQAAARRENLPIVRIPLSEAKDFTMDWAQVERRLQGGEMLIVGQPNNPTGRLFESETLIEVADRHPDTFFVVDEAFADFIPDYTSLVHCRRPNIIIVRSMTKFYAIPGLRLGYAMAGRDLAAALRAFLPPWSVGALAQSVGGALLDDRAYAEKTRTEVTRLRRALAGYLGRLAGLKVFDGEANFLLVKLPDTGMDAVALEDKLLARGLAIRVCANFDGLNERFFRVAVRTDAENRRLAAALTHVLHPQKIAPPARTLRKPALMFLGTSSNAGKSVLTAAMCRILLQDGFRVAPFKAQNMSLNSHVTADGGEMGRAQVVQAQACRLAPDVRMNPVLLKPNSDMGSQVIVMGQPMGNMDVTDYISYKSRIFDTVRRAYDSLAAEADIVVLEGAGSPAEVNLKAHDIVNLSMAEYAGAAALLVGDIDRGGVFASFAGTLDLLSERERALMAGFVINRFRGHQALLQDAIDFVHGHTGLPTYGVVPFVADLGLPEEDSVSFKAEPSVRPTGNEAACVEIAVVDLPHISNFTDFDALKLEPDIRLRVVRHARDLGRPDALILPGSKNVMGDLAYLQQSGLAEGIVALTTSSRVELVGICGGFQMLGREIADPLAVESSMGTIHGLGLLDAVTTLAAEKSLRLVGARHTASGLAVKGYEIHHGHTRSAAPAPSVVREDGEIIGLAADQGRIWGTYLHGIFDDDAFRRWFVDHLRRTRGLAPLGQIMAAYDVDAALDRLAAVVRDNVRISEIYRKIGLT